MKDIFIDNNIAISFANPMSEEVKVFLKWIMQEGSLVVSNKLLKEYHNSMRNCISETNIVVIVGHLQKVGRLNKKSNNELEKFCFKKSVTKKFLSNNLDHSHIKLVVLSHRKLAISKDVNLRKDINGLSKFQSLKPLAYENISDCNYR